MNADQTWQAVLGELQLQLTKPTFDTWVRNTHVISYEDGTFVIGVHNAYAKDWLENRLLTTIKRTLIGIVGQTVDVKFIVCPKHRRKMTQKKVSLDDHIEEAPIFSPRAANGGAKASHAQRSSSNTGLNPQFTFETFIVGNSNRLAHAAARAVAENPGKPYNPLFIYGGVGLGKTHLLQAIGNTALALTPCVLYISSETFTNELINAIRTQSTDEFRAKYRNSTDVLLIDDIQFIAGKESTQEEFFHTFNTLHQAGKQIVMSSDRPPRAIKPLEERLRSRFEQGLIVDIQPPDLETRIAILRAKAESRSIAIPPEVTEFIAGKFPNNVRELEGALNRVVAHTFLMKTTITMEIAAAVLKDILTRTESITVEQVLEAVCKHYGLDLFALKSRQRNHEIAFPRQVAMYLLKEDLDCSLLQIGEILGGRDHTTVLYGYEKIKASAEEDDQLRRDIAAIRDHLYKEHVPATFRM